jgi:hypothetical protein
MTISLYISVDNRISELLKNGTTYDESAIFDTINREFTFLRDPELPKWWARDAMSVWIRMTACWREQEQRERKSGLLVDVKELGKDAAKRFKSDLLVPVKHGFFIVSVGNGKELRKIIVPVGDFLAEGEGVVAGTRFKDLKILALWRLLRQREGSVVDQKRDKLVVKKTLENGSVVDIHLSSNFDLHNGVVWKAFDGSAINLEIVSVSIYSLAVAMVFQ